MAQYHCHVQAISRAPTPKSPKGRSAVACAAYRSGDKLEDERSTRVEGQPVVHDYTRRRGVVHAEIVLPPAAPDWARDRAKLWNAAEAAETKKNSCVAREYVAGLPHELSDGERVDLARAITRALVDRYGFAADFGVHRPDADGDNRNQHVHIQCTTRVMTADGLGAKTRVLDAMQTGPAEICWAREMVARLCNEALARAGIDASVDHRSLVDQRAAALAAGDDERAEELDRPATKHRGPAVEAIVRDGRDSYVEERITAELAEEVDAIGRRQAAEVAVVADIDALDIELVSGREELADIERQVAEALREIADIPDTHVVLQDVTRLWRSLVREDGERDPRRETWPILRLLDLRGWTPASPELRDLLDRSPDLRRGIAEHVESRAGEIRAQVAERSHERLMARFAERRAAAPPTALPARVAPPVMAEPEEEEPTALMPAPMEPAPQMAPRPVRDIDVAIREAEARLDELEARQRARAAATDRARVAAEALELARGGLWARLRAALGWQPPAAVESAMKADEAAQTAALGIIQSQRQTAGLEPAKAGFMGKVDVGQLVLDLGHVDATTGAEIADQLTALRRDRVIAQADESAATKRQSQAVAFVIDLVARLDVAIERDDPRRTEWAALRLLDAQPRRFDQTQIQLLAAQLEREPGMTAVLAYELGQRADELTAIEAEIRIDRQLLGYDDQAPGA